jgi:serine/threonine-protein kinase
VALAIGTRIGPYEVTGPLGAGGMGEVYRAHDTDLKRFVALKVLPAAVVDDPERLARFRREAEVLAQLNHTNIATIYGVASASGVRALVMELVEGPTLADRIAKGPLPLDEALPIAKQIAEALEAAHEQGIVHRDLKPANIKIRPDGAVKVLDFGLAKAMESTGSGSLNMSQSPTITTPAMTQMGMILGTAAYMSPEQAKGKPIDRRTDVWAFGCVLYEMLTGQRAFGGDDVTETLACVITKEPDWAALPAATPARVGELLRRCLRKDVARRIRDMGDVRLEIEEGAVDPVRPVPASQLPTARSPWRWLPTAIAVASVAALSAVATTRIDRAPEPPRRVMQLAVPLEVDIVTDAMRSRPLALSPDGTRLAYVGSRDGISRIYVRALDSLESKALPGTEGAENPFFSPDGQWIGYASATKLMRVSIAGGPPVPMTNATNVLGAHWQNDQLVFAPRWGVMGLAQVMARGGQPQPLSTHEKGARGGARFPQLLPGGAAALYTAWQRNIEDSAIVMQRLDTGERSVLIRGGTAGRYVPTGHVVFVRQGSLQAVSVDLARARIQGSPVPLVDGVFQSRAGVGAYDVSDSGTLAYVSGTTEAALPKSSLVWVDRAGREQPLSAPLRSYDAAPRLSPDGSRVAVTILDDQNNADVWTYDIARESLLRLTFDGKSSSAIWAPDGRHLIYRSERNGALNLYRKAADGSGEDERLTVSDFNQVPSAVSADGNVLVFMQGHPTNNSDLYAVALTAGSKPVPVVQTPGEDIDASLSPDGRWLLYGSDESGRREAFVSPYPGPGGKWQISSGGVSGFEWNRNGREIIYRSGNKLMAVDVATSPAFSVGTPKVLFEGRYVGNVRTVDVSPDGQRFLLVKNADQQALPRQINIVLNWTEELKRRVPTK